jgi:hypothetical protein
VRLVAVALELDKGGASAGARVLHRLLGLIKGVEHVHPVGDEPADPIPRGLVRDVRDGHLLLEARGDREQVVLDDEDDGQLVDRGEVDGLVEVAGAGRGVAAEREDDVLLFQVADRERKAHGMRELGPDAHRAGDDPVLRARELVQDLSARGVRVGRLREDHTELLERRHPEDERHAHVAVVGDRPVLAATDVPRRADLRRLVPVGARAERCPSHAIQLEDALADHARLEHPSVHAFDVVEAQPERVMTRARRHGHPRDGTRSNVRDGCVTAARARDAVNLLSRFRH